MADIEFKTANGETELLSKQVNLKITSDRKLWVNYPNQGRQNYKCTEKRVPKGMSTLQKQVWLLKLRQGILAERPEVAQENTHEEEKDEEAPDEQPQQEEESDEGLEIEVEEREEE